MARLSLHPRYAPRESLFPGNPDLHRTDINVVFSPFLRDCVTAMQDCCEQAHEVQETLRQGTSDLPRMTKILESERVYLLVDEGTIRRYKTELTDEIEPQINELLLRAENGLKSLAKKEKQLRSKVEGLELERGVPSARNEKTAGMNKQDANRVRSLIRRREMLEKYATKLRREVDDMELAAMKA